MVIETLKKVPHRVIRRQYVNYYKVEGGETLIRMTDYFEEFTVMYEYWYDGIKFYIGSKDKNYPNCMVELTTQANAGNPILKKCGVKDVIAQFKECLEKSGVTIHEVIWKYNSRINLNVDAWLTSLLTI